MIRRNKIFVINTDSDGIIKIVPSEDVSRNLIPEHYVDMIIKEIEKYPAPVLDYSFHYELGKRDVLFDIGSKQGITDYRLKIDKIPYLYAYYINFTDVHVNVNIGTKFASNLLNEEGLTIPPNSVAVIKLDRVIPKETKLKDVDLCYHNMRLEYDFYTVKSFNKLEEKDMGKYEDKLETLQGGDKEFTDRYFKKTRAMDTLFQTVRKGMKCNNGIGNFDSDVVCVVDFGSLNDKIIKVIKKFFEVNKQEFHNIYVTGYHKTISDKVNDKILAKELEIIKPKRVAVIGFDNITVDDSIDFMSMPKSSYDIFYNSLGNAEAASSEEYQQTKIMFSQMMKFIITGGR